MGTIFRVPRRWLMRLLVSHSVRFSDTGPGGPRRQQSSFRTLGFEFPRRQAGMEKAPVGAGLATVSATGAFFLASFGRLHPGHVCPQLGGHVGFDPQLAVDLDELHAVVPPGRVRGGKAVEDVL